MAKKATSGSRSGGAKKASSSRAVAESRTTGNDDHCGPEEHARRLLKGAITDEQLERAAASFRAAFKRWTGRRPVDVRRN